MQETLNGYLEQVLDVFQGNPYLEAAAIIVLSLLVAKSVDLIITRIFSRLAARTKTDFDDRLIALIHRPVFLTVLMIGIALAILRLGLPPTVQIVTIRLLKSLASLDG